MPGSTAGSTVAVAKADELWTYLTVLSRALRRDFLRDAIDLWITPDFAALSKAELTARNVALASSFFPAASSATYFFSN